jgi:hypothetical protein
VFLSYATLIVFANFLLDKAAFLDRDNYSDDDETDNTRGGSKSRRSSYPAFEEYLEARPEIKRILTRRTLD